MTTQMNLQNILSETSLSQMDKYFSFHFYEILRIVKFRETKSKNGCCQGLVGGRLLFNRYRVSVLQDENFWR